MIELITIGWLHRFRQSGASSWLKHLTHRRISNPLQIIYIPGLGDPRPAEQKMVTRIWKLYGITAHYYPLVWKDSQSFDLKLQRLISFIDELADSGNAVSLIGVSAGASAVLNAFAQRKDRVQSVICICGKINNFDSVSPDTFAHNPSFRESLAQVPRSLDAIDAAARNRILSLHPLFDATVPIDDTYIKGACNKLFPCVGHSLSIVYADTLGSCQIFNFLQSLDGSFPHP